MLYLQIDFGFLGGFLSGILGAVLNALRAVFLFLWQTIVFITQFIWTALVATVRFLFRMLTHAGRFFRQVWDGVIKKGLLKLIELYAKLREKLEKIFGPLLRWVRRIRQLMDEWFNRWVKPILGAIQRVRRVLRVLKLFNVKWAQALDSRLGRIESRIVANFRVLRGRVNQIIGWLELLTDPSGLIRATVLGRSIAQALNEISLAITGRPLSEWIELPGTIFEGSPNDLHPGFIVQEFSDALRANTGLYSLVREDTIALYNTMEGR